MNHLCTTWFHFQETLICTLMLDHLWSNSTKRIFHSTAKIFIGGVVMRSHSTLDTTPQGIAWVVRSGLCGGHANGARNVVDPWPIQWLAKHSFKMLCTDTKCVCVCVCVCVPLRCSHVIHETPISELRFEPCL